VIQQETYLKSADNSGAKVLRVIRVLGGYHKKYGSVGDIVVCSIREAIPHTDVKKGDVVRAVIVRTKKEIRRDDGTYIRFGDNAAVVLAKGNEPKGTRVFGPVAKELRDKGFMKIVSLAPEVL